MYMAKLSYGLAIYLIANATFANPACYQRMNNTKEKLQDCMTISGLVSHLKAFQEHADNNQDVPGTRMIGTSGYNSSKDYVIKKMTDAGYTVSLQNVPVEINYITTPRIFELTSPFKKTFTDNIDYAPLLNSGVGEVTASVQIPSGKIIGCSPDDFIGFKPGNIALIQHGNSGVCPIRTKVTNAVNAGASAVIIYNDAPGIYFASLSTSPTFKTTPIVFASQEVGTELKTQIQSGAPMVHIKFNAVKKFTESQNIIAESKFGDANHVVVVGAHLDSSSGNPGMNDNGSAAATILETALLMQHNKPENKLRFAWWTGEEEGLIGSTYYVNHLDAKEKEKISLYLNYEILGAPNGGRMIMGTDGDTPPGSEKIAKLYADYFRSQHLKFYIFDPKLANAVHRSDMYAFAQAGIPVGYLVSGAEIPWNPLFTAIFTDLPNRIEGMATHPCYHRLCDKLTMLGDEMKDPNFDFDLYLQMSKAAAFAINFYSENNIIDGKQL